MRSPSWRPIVRPRADASPSAWTTWITGAQPQRLAPASPAGRLVSRPGSLQPPGCDNTLEKLLRPRVARRREDLLGRRLLEDDTLVEEADPVGDVARESHLVGGDEHCHAGSRKFANDVEHLGDEL